MQPNEFAEDKQDQKVKRDDSQSKMYGIKKDEDNTTEGTRAAGIGDGGSSSQTNAAGSDGNGGLGSIAEGIQGASGDSVKGAQAMANDQE